MGTPMTTQSPQPEDFARKYTVEGRGLIGGRLIDGYFRGIESLFQSSELARRPSVRAVEIGCGEGFSTQRLRKLLPRNVQLIASEYEAALVPRAQERNPDVPIANESVYRTSYADNSFDLVFLLEVLEHLARPETALAELSRIVKDDGYLVVGVPREPLWCALNLARGKYVKSLGNTPGHVNHWSSLGLKHLVSRHFGPVLAVRHPLPWTQVLTRKRAQ